MPVKKNEVVKACRKLGFEEKTTRRGKHIRFVYKNKGIEILHITIPHGRDILPTGTEHAIRGSFYLDVKNFTRAVRCPLKKAEFKRIISELIEKGQLLISSTSPFHLFSHCAIIPFRPILRSGRLFYVLYSYAG